MTWVAPNYSVTPVTVTADVRAGDWRDSAEAHMAVYPKPEPDWTAEIISDAGSDNTYRLNDIIEMQLTPTTAGPSASRGRPRS